MSGEKKKPQVIELNKADLAGLLERLSRNALTPADGELIRQIIDTFLALGAAAEQKDASLRRLLKMLFGSQTESKDNLFGNQPASTAPAPEDASAGEAPATPSPANEPAVKAKTPGHGRRPASDYEAAKQVAVAHEELKSGNVCPKCNKGKVYDKDPEVLIRVTGAPPLSATAISLQRLRCNLCGTTFTARRPEGVGEEKFDAKAISMIAILKYGTGMPFHRMQKLQKHLRIPLPASTQWEAVDEKRDLFKPTLERLKDTAANGNLVHNDDTPAIVLEMTGKRKAKSAAVVNSGSDPPKRSGCFTTGIVSDTNGLKIALYFTGPNHAGENLAELLKRRSPDLPPPIQMCDGLSRNIPGEMKTLLANCLAHGRRNFVEVLENFPIECRHVIEQIALVYKTDALAREQNLDPEQRLLLHQKESAPVMMALKQWMDEQLDNKLIEPNSGLGHAIRYFQKRWGELTLFLRQVGAPLDNNICEQALKKAILSRKNAYFYKTLNGAKTGDMFMSLIHTCELNGANPFEYLTALQEHQMQVKADPDSWMPWNYTDKPVT